MGRPPLSRGQPTVEKKVRAPQSWWAKVEAEAREQGVFPSELIRRIVDAALRD
jgi:hypothetical protein